MTRRAVGFASSPARQLASSHLAQIMRDSSVRSVRADAYNAFEQMNVVTP